MFLEHSLWNMLYNKMFLKFDFKYSLTPRGVLGMRDFSRKIVLIQVATIICRRHMCIVQHNLCGTHSPLRPLITPTFLAPQEIVNPTILTTQHFWPPK